MEERKLTWEWIIAACEGGIKAANEAAERYPGQQQKFVKQWIDKNNGLLNAAVKLRAHPHLENLVAYMGVSIFHWWPTPDTRVWLNYDNDLGYQIGLEHHQHVVEEVIVSLDDAAETI